MDPDGGDSGVLGKEVRWGRGSRTLLHARGGKEEPCRRARKEKKHPHTEEAVLVKTRLVITRRPPAPGGACTACGALAMST